MVPGTSGHEPLSSDQALTSGGSSVTAVGKSSAPELMQSTPLCLEIERQQLTAYDLPLEVVDVVLAAMRPSIKSVYARH